MSSPYNADYSSKFVDWGVNVGGDDVKWVTLSGDEWKYVYSGRSNADQRRGIAEVDGITGLILLPDEWILPSGLEFKNGVPVNIGGAEYYKLGNQYTADEWTLMEKNGAVFLPSAGTRYGSTMMYVGTSGGYYSIFFCQ